MKKSICIILGISMFMLSACGSKVDVNINQPADTDNEVTADASEEKDEETADPKEDEAPAEDDAQVTATQPVYKLVRQYFSEDYSGSSKTDGSGDSLEGRQVYDGMTETIMVADACKDQFPKLYENFNLAAKEEFKSNKENAESMIEQANADADSSADDERPFIGPWTDYSTENIIRADEKVVSYICDFSNFTGGAHGSYGRTAATYDVESGEKLELTDVADTTIDQLAPAIKDKLLEKADEDDFFPELDDTLKSYSLTSVPDGSEEVSLVWYLGFDGIHFYFGPYALAAYAMGDWDIVIGYDEFPGTVDEKYLPDTDRGYVTASNLWFNSSSAEEDSDETLHFVYEGQEEEFSPNGFVDCTALSLRQGSKSAKAEDEYFSFSYVKDSCRQYKVVTADKKEYIYVNLLTYNDYVDVAVFDITGGDIKFAGAHTCHVVYEDFEDDTYAGEFIPTDPENLYYSEVGDLIGTYSCYGRYVVGADGLPEFADKYYTMAWGADPVKSVQDIEVTVLDENGDETGTETLPAGTKYRPLRTDNKTYMDCEIDDGREVRLKYSSSGYPAEINGKSVDDLFENLMYAG
ncbi:MAG: DUF3298 and DUF4163 domain-containing protein [Lachnospiraceae bacterium]|nr:DUF3298 and DUF4163 domain-containing protein [Lachnospiraceae bacterium]